MATLRRSVLQSVPHRHASDVSRFFIRLLQETGRSDTFDSVPFPECHDSITAGAGQGDVIALFIGFIDIVILQVDAIVAEVGLCSEAAAASSPWPSSSSMSSGLEASCSLMSSRWVVPPVEI